MSSDADVVHDALLHQLSDGGGVMCACEEGEHVATAFWQGAQIAEAVEDSRTFALFQLRNELCSIAWDAVLEGTAS